MTLHFSQIGLTDDLTFTVKSSFHKKVRLIYYHKRKNITTKKLIFLNSFRNATSIPCFALHLAAVIQPTYILRKQHHFDSVLRTPSRCGYTTYILRKQRHFDFVLRTSSRCNYTTYILRKQRHFDSVLRTSSQCACAHHIYKKKYIFLYASIQQIYFFL